MYRVHQSIIGQKLTGKVYSLVQNSYRGIFDGVGYSIKVCMPIVQMITVAFLENPMMAK